jgi:hypothetical protein
MGASASAPASWKQDSRSLFGSSSSPVVRDIELAVTGLVESSVDPPIVGWRMEGSTAPAAR